MQRYNLGLAGLLLVFLANMVSAQDYIIWYGGVSEEERLMAPDTGTRLVFFVSSGSFLSDIAVTVTNSAGTDIVDMTVGGPWLILDLPAGSYAVEAVRGNGDVQSLTIEVSEGQNQEIGFMFPES